MKKRNLAGFVLFLALMLILSGCDRGPIAVVTVPTSTATPTFTLSPTATSIPTNIPTSTRPPGPTSTNTTPTPTLPPSATTTLELVGHMGGVSQAIFGQGNYIYLGMGAELAILDLDVSEATQPVRVGYVVLSDVVQHIYVAGDYAYVATGEGNLSLVDVSNPADPVAVSLYHTPGDVQGVVVRGSFVYVADGEYGLRVLDVSEPTAPTEVGFYDTIPRSVRDVAVVGNYVYIITNGPQCLIVDVSDPTAPVGVGVYDLPGYVQDITVVDNYAYFAEDTGIASEFAGVRIVDISNSTEPTEIGFYTIGDTFSGFRVQEVAVADNYAYVLGSGGLRVVDVSDAATPTLVGSYETPWFTEWTNRRASKGDSTGETSNASSWYIPRLVVRNNYAYVADRQAGLRVIDISNPAVPTEVGFYRTSSQPSDVTVAGDYAYVHDMSGGLQVLNVSDPAAPIGVGFYELYPGGVTHMTVVAEHGNYETGLVAPPGTSTVAVQGNYVYVIDKVALALRVIDVSDPATPVEMGFWDTMGYPLSLAVVDGQAYIVGGASRMMMGDSILWVVDISDVTAPVEVGSLSLPGEGAFDVAVVDNQAYVAISGAGLRVVDVSDPAVPTEVGFYDTGAGTVAVEGNYAYVNGDSRDLRIVDVSDPAAPVEVGFYTTPGVLEVAVAGAYTYVADGYSNDDQEWISGLHIVDISDPTTPSSVGFSPLSVNAIAVANGYLYVSGGGGLYILRYNTAPASTHTTRPQPTNISPTATPPPAAIKTLEPVGHIGGVSQAVFAQGDHIYLGLGAELAILDVSEATQPVRVGYVVLPDVVQDIYIAGDYAYVAAGEGGLWLVDVSNPVVPIKVSVYNTPGFAQDVVARSSFVYVAAGQLGLRVLDVSYPATPTEIGFYDLPGPEFAVHDLAVAGDYVYMANNQGDLRVVNVSDPTAPVEVGFYNTEYALDVAAVGSYAYFAGFKGVRIVDISNPTALVQVGLYDREHASDITVVGDYVYLVDNDRSLRILDVSNTGVPTLVGVYDTPGTAWDVAVMNGYAYVADGMAGLRVIDVSNPATPIEVGFYETLAWPLDVAVAGDYAYVTDTNKGLRVVDISNPKTPFEVGFLERVGYFPPGGNTSVAALGGYVYIVNKRALGVIDVSDPATPVAVGFWDTMDELRSVTVVDHYAYVVGKKSSLGDNASLWVVDISDPTTPVAVGSSSLPGVLALDVAAVDNHAYVATVGAGLRIVDVSDPTLATEIGFYNTAGPAIFHGVVVVNNYAYIVGSEDGPNANGLRVVDISDPTAPVEVGFYPTIASARDVAVVSPYAYAAGGSISTHNREIPGGLQVVNTLAPTPPTKSNFYDLPSAEGVTVANGYVYVSGGTAGLYILSYSASVE